MASTQNNVEHPNWAANHSVEDLSSFSTCLRNSSRIVALIGAGLSASSGIPTFRGAGAGTLWRGVPVRDLATPYCFRDNPVLFWQFHDHRRYLALKASPNRGHYSLAKLALLKPEFMAISQNIDGLSERAGHDPRSLLPFHGTLLDLECSNDQCDCAIHDSFNDHVISNFNPPQDSDLADLAVELPATTISQLPHCPICQSLMRPATVLFYEKLYASTLEKVDDWFAAGGVDLALVIGTSAVVSPAADYIERALELGARVAVIDMAPPMSWNDDRRFGDNHWYFHGDAAEILPELLKPVIGES